MGGLKVVVIGYEIGGWWLCHVGEEKEGTLEKLLGMVLVIGFVMRLSFC